MSSLCGAHSVPRHLNPHWGPCLDVGGMIPSLLCVPQHSWARVVRTCCNLPPVSPSPHTHDFFSPCTHVAETVLNIMNSQTVIQTLMAKWTVWKLRGEKEGLVCIFFFFLLKGRWSELEAFFSLRKIKKRVKQKHWIFVDMIKPYLYQQSFLPSQKVNKHVNLAQNIIEVQNNILQFPHLVAIIIIICFVACWIKWQGPFCYACHWLYDNK